VCLSNRAAVSTSLERWGAVLADCDRALELNPAFAKALRRRAAALEKLHLLDEAEADCKRLLGGEFDAQLQPRDAEQLRGDMARLGELRKARDEKLAADMLGKLKDMGNGLLKSACASHAHPFFPFSYSHTTTHAPQSLTWALAWTTSSGQRTPPRAPTPFRFSSEG
jgi:tetratricopeptide (TPR) repeat protein